MLYAIVAFLAIIALWFFIKGFKKPSPERLKQIYKYLFIICGLGFAFILLRLGLPYIAAAVGFISAFFPYIRRVIQIISALGFIRKIIGTNKTKSAKNIKLTAKEAREILGVSENASREEIKNAYNNLMKKNHPDYGGSKYLASQLNAARDILLKNE